MLTTQQTNDFKKTILQKKITNFILTSQFQTTASLCRIVATIHWSRPEIARSAIFRHRVERQDANVELVNDVAERVDDFRHDGRNGANPRRCEKAVGRRRQQAARNRFERARANGAVQCALAFEAVQWNRRVASQL